MQDLQLMQSGAGGRFFGGERRLRPFPNQALKCPRCDSLNTKFCYYNNYNLSQPRHFCKSCRRYWTKGGVLRNVPVGGGCRKAKRSKPKSSSASDQRKEQKRSSSNSSSDSSSLTPTAAATTATITNDAPACSSSVPAGLLNFQSSRLVADQAALNPNFPRDQSSDNGIFAENGSFTSLMNVGNTYNFSEILPFQLNHQEIELQQQQQEEQEKMIEEMKMQELTGGIDFSEIQNRNCTGEGELTALDWHSSQGLFDLPPNTVDQGYWTQNQWTETNQHIYLP